MSDNVDGAMSVIVGLAKEEKIVVAVAEGIFAVGGGVGAVLTAIAAEPFLIAIGLGVLGLGTLAFVWCASQRKA